MSKNATLLASVTLSRVSVPLVRTFHPLRPLPSSLQPAIPFAQGTDNTSLGIRSPDGPVTEMGRRSGNPSRLASPNLRGSGTAGLDEVSRTRRADADRAREGNKEETGKLTNAYKCLPVRMTTWYMATGRTSLSLLSLRSNLKLLSAVQSSSGGRHKRFPFLTVCDVEDVQRGSC